MKDTNKIVIFDWGGVIENNNPEEYTINKAIIDIMRKYNCNLSNEEIDRKSTRLNSSHMPVAD